MDPTMTAVVAGVVLLVGLGASFGVWSWLQRRKVSAHWKSIAAKGGATYKGGFMAHPMLEMKAGDFDVRLMLATYRRTPDRVVVHVSVPTLPANFAIGRIGLSHAVGRAIGGYGGSERIPLDEVRSGWEVCGDDALALRRYAGDPALVSALQALVAIDPEAAVEWALVKYSTEELPMDDASLTALVDVGLGVATQLARLSR